MAIEAHDGETPNSRSSDPVTSVDAGRSVNVVHSREYVRQSLRVYGEMADHELVAFHEDDSMGQRAFGRFSPQRLRSARSELVDLGEVEATGEFCMTPSGRRAHIWRTVPREE